MVTTTIRPHKACSCQNCLASKRKKTSKTKKQMKRAMNKKIRKMDFEKPFVVSFVWS